MITFNPEATLGFKAYRRFDDSGSGLLSTNMLEFFSLTHFIECEKYTSQDYSYYSYLASLRDIDSVLIETRGVSSDRINKEFSYRKDQIILSGLHFLISQNRFYFEDFLNMETELVCADPDLQDLFIYYRKRHIFAQDTARVAVVGSKNQIDRNLVLNHLSEEFKNDTPEEIVISTSPGVSELAEIFAHNNYIPISRGTAKRKEDGREWQMKRLERMAQYASSGLVMTQQGGNNKDADLFLELMSTLNKSVRVIQL